MTTKIYGENVYGNNQLGSKDLFKQRLKYQNLYPDNVSYEDPEAVKSDTTNAIDKFTLPDGELGNIKTPEPINFWSTKYSSYGKKDNNGNYIVPKQDQLKQIRTQNETIFVLNFVSEAFEDFVEFVKTEKANRLHPDDFLTQNIEAKRGWYDSQELYDNMKSKYYDSFVNSFLPQNQLERKITDFNGFLDIFLNTYLSGLVHEFPITKTGLLESNKVGPNASGLCVEISTDDHGDDYNKFNKYINNINFEFYKLAAAKFGFFVDKNAPWRLVANLNSPVMKDYIQKHFFTIDSEGDTTSIANHHHSFTVGPDGKGITGPPKQTGNEANFALVADHVHEIENGKILIKAVYGEDPLVAHVHGFGFNKKLILNWTTNDLYNQYYSRTYAEDIDQLKTYFKDSYELFVDQFPTIEIPTVCNPDKDTVGGYYGPSSSRKTIMKTIYRKYLTDKEFEEKYNDLFWLKTYLLIRIKEKTNGLGELDDKLNKVMSDINQAYYFVDKSAALEYIQQYLKQYY